jgi:hypothetical protein
MNIGRQWALGTPLLAATNAPVHAQLGGGLHTAPTCEQFKATIIEGAAKYNAPAPVFRLEHVNSADADIQYWTITSFNDVRAMISCWHGSVGTFAADANDSEGMSSVHLSALIGIGLYGYGVEWRQALDLRDKLLRAAKASDLQTARLAIDGVGEASLVISIAGVPSFQIDTEH